MMSEASNDTYEKECTQGEHGACKPRHTGEAAVAWGSLLPVAPLLLKSCLSLTLSLAQLPTTHFPLSVSSVSLDGFGG